MLFEHIKYLLKAHYWHGHHVHSPYTYWIMTNVVYERWPYYSFERIEGLRNKTNAKERGTLGPKYCQLIQRLCATNNALNLQQIGSEAGWETMYMASNNTHAIVNIDATLSSAAKKRIQLLGYHNHKEHSLLESNIDMLLCLNGSIHTTFHRFADRMSDGGIMIFSRIHESREWEEVIQDPRIRVSMDFFRIGVCWFRNEMQKQDYIVKF